MVRHRALAALIDGADDGGDLIRFDVAGRPVTPQRIRDLVEALFRLLPGRFFRVLEVSDIGLEEIGDGSRSRVAGDLDTAALLDHVREIAVEHLSRLAEWH